jgi:hypothetical protein
MAIPRKSTKPDKLNSKGLSLKALIKFTPAYIRANAQDVIIKKYVANAITKGGYPAVTAICQDLIESQRKHICSIVGKNKDEDSLAKQSQVIVSCACENYMYYWEYSNFKNGCSRIIYSNGQPALITNPSNHPALCKHLYTLAVQVMSRKD